MLSVYQLFEKIHLFLKDNHSSSLFQSWQVCAVLSWACVSPTLTSAWIRDAAHSLAKLWFIVHLCL